MGVGYDHEVELPATIIAPMGGGTKLEMPNKGIGATLAGTIGFNHAESEYHHTVLDGSVDGLIPPSFSNADIVELDSSGIEFTYTTSASADKAGPPSGTKLAPHVPCVALRTVCPVSGLSTQACVNGRSVLCAACC